jgi:hypothetical protein
VTWRTDQKLDVRLAEHLFPVVDWRSGVVHGEQMSTLQFLRNEIENRRRQLSRQRKEIQSLKRAGISTASAEELFSRIVAEVIELCANVTVRLS